jgi:hypothetical protein
MGGSGLQRNAYQVGKIHQPGARFAQIYDAMVLNTLLAELLLAS